MKSRTQQFFMYLGLAVLLLFVSPTPALAEITEVRIGVDGMTTAYAAGEAQKALSRLESVDTVEVRDQPAQAVVTLNLGDLLDIGKLRDAIVEAGLTPTWIRFEAVGVLTTENGIPGFKVQGTGQVIPLEADRKLERRPDSKGKGDRPDRVFRSLGLVGSTLLVEPGKIANIPRTQRCAEQTEKTIGKDPHERGALLRKDG